MVKYYVTYAHKSGMGYCEVSRDQEINTCEDVIEMEKAIGEKGNITDIIILNYIFLPNKDDKAVNKDE